jgi:hypothetical protein
MSAANKRYGIVGEELLPFTPLLLDNDKSFRVEISLVSARFNTQSSAVDSSSAVAPLCVPDAAFSSSDASAVGEAAPSTCSAAPLPKIYAKKQADTSVYALPKLKKKATVFKSQIQGKVPEAAVTVSPDPNVADEVIWEEGSCVAVFENLKMKEVVEISVTRAKKTKNEKQPFMPIEALNSVTVNVASFASTAQPAVPAVHILNDKKLSLTLRITTSPVVKRQLPTNAQEVGSPVAVAGGGTAASVVASPASSDHVAFTSPVVTACGNADLGQRLDGHGKVKRSSDLPRTARSHEDIEKAAECQLGRAQKGYDLLIKVDPDCNFEIGAHIGIAVEEAWRGKNFMLFHKLSKFEACSESAENYFGKVVKFEAEDGFKVMQVQCPKADKTQKESKFGWRLLSACSDSLKSGVMQLEPFSPFDGQNIPLICCIFLLSSAAKCDDDEAKKNEGNLRAKATLQEKAIEFKQFQDIKEQALSLCASPFKLTSDELGMVRLRQGFLASQPLISHIVRHLMMPVWFPGKMEDTCIKYLRSKEGPWDIFYVFEFLRQAGNPKNAESKGRKNIFQLLASFLFGRDANDKQSRLQIVLDQIFHSRNWWAHVGVGSANCSQALLAIIEFINMVVESRKYPADDMQRVHTVMSELQRVISDLNSDDYSSVKLSLDDISYIFYLRSSLELCTLCTQIYKTCPNMEFSEKLKEQLVPKAKKGSRRQSDIIEPLEITSAVQNMGKLSLDLAFDCKMILRTRHGLAHAHTRENRVILVLIALGAISRVTKFLAQCCSRVDCSLKTEARHSSTKVTTMQAELLGRSGLLQPGSIDRLTKLICQSNKQALDSCAFKEHLTSDFHKLQMLLCRRVAGRDEAPQGSSPRDKLGDDSPQAADSLAKCDAKEDKKSLKKCLTSLLRLIAHIPLKNRSSAQSAIDWLFDATWPDPGLLNCSGLHVLKSHLDQNNCLLSSRIATTPDLQTFCTLLDDWIDKKSKLAAVLWTFRLALDSDKNCIAEQQFCQHQVRASLSDVQCWEGRKLFFTEMDAEELSRLSSNVLDALNAQNEAKIKVDSSSISREPAALQYVYC